MIIAYCYILICNEIVKLSVISYAGSLHKDTILDLCALAYLNASEENGIFNLSLDDTTVGNKRILNSAVKVVFSRSGKRITSNSKINEKIWVFLGFP